MRKTHIWVIIASALLIIIGVGVTVAYLVASSNTVRNTFTVGFVDIELRETTKEYKIIPGATVEKDPIITVKKGSERCWLFVKVEKTGDFDAYCTYQIADGWYALAGHSGVYYREVGHALADMPFGVLKDNCIQIGENISEGQLELITENPILKFTAYAAQGDSLDSAHVAWQLFEE